VVLGWSDAALFWSAVDCAISTSDNEGMPISLIEAQLAGIPVIATDVGSTSEVIKDGTTGILTKSNELELIQAVNRFVMDNAMMEKIGIASKKYASKEFSVEKMIESHKKAYLQLL
jgi:glycosyltransferase involved in cell wall biosynthesis